MKIQDGEDEVEEQPVYGANGDYITKAVSLSSLECSQKRQRHRYMILTTRINNRPPHYTKQHTYTHLPSCLRGSSTSPLSPRSPCSPQWCECTQDSSDTGSCRWLDGRTVGREMGVVTETTSLAKSRINVVDSIS